MGAERNAPTLYVASCLPSPQRVENSSISTGAYFSPSLLSANGEISAFCCGFELLL